MDSEFAQLSVDFNNNARKIFFVLYTEFSDSIKKLDRKRDDNVFQQQQGKYIHALKSQLEDLAREILNKNRTAKSIEQLNRRLMDEINMYLNQFRQKSRSL